MTTRDEIDQALRAGGGVIAVHHHPELARTIHRQAARGILSSPLPRIYCRAEDAADVGTLIRAAVLAAPGAVITGPAAAWLTYWPTISVPVVTLSRRGRLRVRAGYRLSRKRLPPDLVIERRGARVTTPALTALDLVPWVGGRGIDEVLRTRSATLDQLHEALSLTSGRHGNTLRRAALHDSRREPWSEAERLLHHILVRAGVRGWSGNVAVSCAGQSYPVDALFRRRRLIIEVDGHAFHRSENVEQFHRDRRKWSALTADGWTVLHFTWDHLVYEPEWVVATVRRALAVSRISHAA